jgi:hypothetical protein
MDRDSLDDFIDELINLARQDREGRDSTTIEYARDRTRIAFIKAISEFANGPR